MVDKMEMTENEAICGKYDSPLDHMQSSAIDSVPDVRCVFAFKTRKKNRQKSV